MPKIQQSDVSNGLLRGMPEADFARLGPHLSSVTTQLRQIVIAMNVPIRHLYFPETGFISITTEAGGNAIEVGVIGREGLAGAMPVLLGGDRTPFVHMVQSAGELLSIDVDRLSDAVDESATLRRMLLRFVHVLWIQTAQTAYANAALVIEARLARWLLMCQDRLDGPELLLTHEFLSMMLGVQRTSVTLALQVLEGNGIIRARRGRIEIQDRAQLRIVADTGYGLPEAEYAALIRDR